MSSYSHLVLIVVILFSVSSFANKELWEHAYKGEWEPVRELLNGSATAKQDLAWFNDKHGSTVRDLLIGCRDNIRVMNRKLYETLFADNGLIGWITAEGNVDVDNFFAAAKIEQEYQNRNQIWNFESLTRYQTVLVNTFSQQELQELSSIYQDPDFQLFNSLTKGVNKEEETPKNFALERPRSLILGSLVSLIFSGIPLSEVDHNRVLYLMSNVLSDFSNDRIRTIAQKLTSPVCVRESIMRRRLLQ